MLGNGYIDSRVQKGFLEGVAGCVEHTSMQWEMLKHAKSKQRQIVMAWLDLENAYGSVRHMLVPFALKWYHVPQKVSTTESFLKLSRRTGARTTFIWVSEYRKDALPRQLCLMLHFRWFWICGSGLLAT